MPPAQSDFTRIRAIDVDALTTLPVDFNVGGRDEDHDVLRVGDLLYVTGNAPSGSSRTLYAFEATSGAPPESVAAQVDLGDANRLRLAGLPEHDALLISVGTQNRVVRVALSTHLLDAEFAIPVQIVPTGIGLAGGGQTIVVWNAFSNTLSVIDAATVLDAAAPPAYTTIDTTPEAPVDELLDYRQDADAAYFALLKQAGQYLKDCFCEKFLVDCPECGPDDKVYLGCVEVREGRVYHVCNFTKRHYVKSFRTYGYWLSTVPILPLLKRAFAEFCCLVLDPGS
ncbi:MAG: hypothetical protein GWO04_07850 [Actinobacteria bacterium]|nr:hypothetical protein [Actinomycetota bacterium]NIW26975.1 hypothetical protein [Actinomycetota bacterium]